MFTSSGLHIDQAPPLNVPFRFFGTAPVFMVMAGIALLFWGEDLTIAPLAAETVATVHLATLGWITMMMFGAIYQMIPVLASIRVPWLGLASWVHGALVIGLVTMFLEIGIGVHPWLMLVASLGLGVAVGLFILQVTIALFKAPAKHPTVTAMRLAVFCLTLTLIMGGTFLGEYSHGFFPIDRSAMVGTHLVWALLGWVTVMILGVSFQVLPMFYVMPTYPEDKADWTLAGIAISLLFIPATLFLEPDNPGWWLVAGLPALLGIGLYAVTMYGLFTQRKRRLPDVTIQFWKLGYAMGFLSLLAIMIWPFADDERLRFLFGILFLFGWTTSIIIGMLYKIVPFLVWFHRFSKLAGLVKIPMMDDLTPKSAQAHIWVHAALTIVFAVAMWFESTLGIQLAGILLLVTAAMTAHGIWYAVRQEPPEAPETPDFASFFKDMPPPPDAPPPTS